MICAVWQGLKVPVFQNVDGAGVVHRIYFLFSEWYINGLPNTHLLGSDLLSRKTMVIQFLRNVGQTFETMCIDSFSSVLPQDVCMFLLLILTNLQSPSCSKEDTVVVHVHVCATLYPTQCFQLKRIAIFNSVRAQIYIPVHLITNPTKAVYMLIPANFFRVKCMRFSCPKMSQ